MTTWGTILDEAADIDASAIVLGSRGLSGVTALVIGSVSHAVVQRADHPSCGPIPERSPPSARPTDALNSHR